MRVTNQSMNVKRHSRRGAVLISALVVVVILAGMSAALLGIGTNVRRESDGARDSARALYMAEAGLSEVVALFEVSANDPSVDPPTGVGRPDAPMTLRSGEYWVDVVPTDDYFTVTSYGYAGTQRRAVQAILARPGGGIYDNALFAGNSERDETYTMDLGGIAGQADTIIGDVFSGGDLGLYGDSTVDGDLRAGGGITGGKGEEGVKQPLPDIAAMDYPNNNDVDVASEFSRGGSSYVADALGGTAWQLPEANPAHIFRVNPSDRRTEIQSTKKNDFFLEDPYEPVMIDRNQDGKDASHITLSGTMGRPGPNGSGLVYYIDGNLWVHNKKSYSFKFFTQQDEKSRVTFVVSGNIYFSDNLFLMNKNNDGVAFIATKDKAVKDSGNIYFGDPAFGTLKYMAAFMFAENNFYDNNLDANGSSEVSVMGNMTAGNQILINRDYGNKHTKLSVEWDSRISSGELDLPGLPPMTGGEGSDYQVVSWREVTPQP